MYYIFKYRWTCGRLLSLFFTSFLRPFDCPRKVLVSLVNYPAKGNCLSIRFNNHHIQMPKKSFFRTKSFTCLPPPTHPLHVGLDKTQKGNCSVNFLDFKGFGAPSSNPLSDLLETVLKAMKIYTLFWRKRKKNSFNLKHLFWSPFLPCICTSVWFICLRFKTLYFFVTRFSLN